ncbi:MAG: hypothetical protein WD489_06130 [Rhodovibrionaceae bacterium]
MKIAFRCPPELEALLPRPIPAREGLPAWLRAMPQFAEEPDLGFELRTLKHCPPFVDAMGTGFLVPLSADVQVSQGRFSWDWDLPPSSLGETTRAPLSFHYPAQVEGTPLHAPDTAVIKFNNFWTVELPEGVSLLVLHPINREELPFRSLTGVVDADLYKDAFIQFPARWCDPGFEGTLQRGTPVAQCIPFRREALELAFEGLEGEGAAAFREVQAALAEQPGVYRKRFRAKRR